MKQLSMTSRLLLLLLVSILPAFAVLLFNLTSARSAAYDDLKRTALSDGQTAYQEVMRILASARSTLDVLVDVPQVQAEGEACSTFLAPVARKMDMLANIAVLNRQGDVLCSSNPAGSQNFADRDYFKDAEAKSDFVVGTYVVDRITGRKVLPLALPVPGKPGQILVGLLDLEWLRDWIRTRDFSAGNALTVADRNGTIIAREPFSERFVGTRIPDRYLPLVRSGEPGAIEVASQDGTLRMIGYYPANEGIYVSAGLSVSGELEPIRSVTSLSVVGGILGLAGMLAVLWYAGSEWIRKPAYQLYETIMSWRRGETHVRTGMQGNSEFEMIGSAVDDFMNELLASREQRLKDERVREILINELDHRMKNLLATVQAVARQTLQSGRPYAEEVAIFMDRIQALAAAQQLLTRNWQSAPLALTVKTAVSPFAGSGSQPGRIAISGNDLPISAAAALTLSMALHELCTNASKYGALSVPQGRVNIAWQLDEGRFRFFWQEVGGPVTHPPAREGFGLTMISRLLAQQLDGHVRTEFAMSGLKVELDAPLGALLVSEGLDLVEA